MANNEFHTKVGHNVFWVSKSTLGSITLSENQIKKYANLDFTQKPPVNSLNDAILLLQSRNFQESLDNITMEIDNHIWEFHKPGELSYVTNTGCCASCASWFLYVLEKVYEDIGYITIIRENGFGHALVYVKHRQLFYIIDPTTYLNKYRYDELYDTGRISDFSYKKLFTSSIIETDSLYNWCNYYNRFLKYGQVSHLIIVQHEKTCMPISCYRQYDKIVFRWPSTCKASFLYADTNHYECIPYEMELPCPQWSFCGDE